MRELVTVAIPLFHASLTPVEEAILQHSMTMLQKYPIIWLCAEGVTPPEPACMEGATVSVFQFPEKYFDSKAAFSKLLLLPDFYERFSWAENLLMHPLDTWMVKNELHYWCKQGYDLLMAAPDWEQSQLKPNLKGQLARMKGPSMAQKQSLGGAFGAAGFYLCHIEQMTATLNTLKKEAYSYRHDDTIPNADMVFWELVPNRLIPRLRKPSPIVQNFFAQQQSISEDMIAGKIKNIPFAISGIQSLIEIDRVHQITSISP